MTPSKRLRILIYLVIYFSSPNFIYTASIGSREDPCPVISNFCECIEGQLYTVNCKNISNFNEIYDILDNFTDKTFVFELESLNWTSIPEQALQSPFILALLIKNSAFESLFNTTESIVTNETNILRHLSVENVTTSEWDWNYLHFLQKLDIFFAYNSTIGEILPSDFSQYCSKTLKFLAISQSNISHIEPGSLKDLKELAFLRLSHSKLNTLTRDVLPSPTKIAQLRLDHNFITSFPDGMFENMPNLLVITLSNNRISLLPEEVFRPLWRPGVHLELRNNPIKCDCRMRWIVTTPYKPMIIGQCNYPKRLFGKNISDLTEEDLIC